MAAMRRELRLGSIVFLLKVHKRLTADELAEKLGVATRSVYRDVQSLVSAGLPIRSLPGHLGGYVLDEEAVPVDPMVYSRDDLVSSLGDHDFAQLGEGKGRTVRQALDAGLQLIADALPKADADLLREIGNRFLFDTTNWFWNEKSPGNLPELKRAVLQDRRIEVLYVERSGSPIRTERMDPYGLVWRQGRWYLVAFSAAKNAFVRYRLQRIVGVRDTGERFDREPSFHLATCWASLLEDFGQGDIQVRLKIHPSAVHDFEVFGWKEGDRFEKVDSSWIATLYVNDYAWLVPLILSFGDGVEVLAPPSLRDRVAREIHKVVRRYANEAHVNQEPARRSP